MAFNHTSSLFWYLGCIVSSVFAALFNVCITCLLFSCNCIVLSLRNGFWDWIIISESKGTLASDKAIYGWNVVDIVSSKTIFTKLTLDLKLQYLLYY